ncbi:MAG TPA: hypothetical protein VFK27_03520, partial [Bacillales bacterium]|nr:hypothetical protein [Bacillales bacterium]
FGVKLSHDQFTTQKLADALRYCKPPVISRVKDEKVFLDFRTIADGEFEELLGAMRQLDLMPKAD